MFFALQRKLFGAGVVLPRVYGCQYRADIFGNRAKYLQTTAKVGIRRGRHPVLSVRLFAEQKNSPAEESFFGVGPYRIVLVVGNGVASYLFAGVVAGNAGRRCFYANLAFVQFAAAYIVVAYVYDDWVGVVGIFKFVVFAAAADSLRQVALCLDSRPVDFSAAHYGVFRHTRFARANTPYARQVHGLLVHPKVSQIRKFCKSKSSGAKCRPKLFEAEAGGVEPHPVKDQLGINQCPAPAGFNLRRRLRIFIIFSLQTKTTS
jgi:hypothetical protein